MAAPDPPVPYSLTWSNIRVQDVIPPPIDHPEIATDPTDIRLIGGTSDTRFLMAWAHRVDTYVDNAYVGLFEVTDTGVTCIEQQKYAEDSNGVYWENLHSAQGVYIGQTLRDDTLPGFRFRAVIVREVAGAIDITMPLIPQEITDDSGLFTNYAIDPTGTHWAVAQPIALNHKQVWVFDIDTNTQQWTADWWEPAETAVFNSMVAFPAPSVIITTHSDLSAYYRIAPVTVNGMMAPYEEPYTSQWYNGDFGPYFSWRNLSYFKYGYFTSEYSGTGRYRGFEVSALDETYFTGPLYDFVEISAATDYQIPDTWDDLAVMSPYSGSSDPETPILLINGITSSSVTFGRGENTYAAAPIHALLAHSGLVVLYGNYLSYYRLGAEIVYYPMRMSQRNDTYGVVQRSTRMNNSIGSRSSSSYTSNRVFGNGNTSYI